MKEQQYDSSVLQELEELLALNVPTKGQCKQINELRKTQLDGHYIENCFCTANARTSFIADTKYWLRGVKGETRGLGDSIARVTKFFGIEPCEGCKERQESLNKSLPYND